MESFDVIVIGGGPGGYVCAIRCAQLGLKTAVVERDRLGGICLNWGCIPTKALLRSSEIWHLMHRLNEFGFSADNLKFDIAKIVERSRKVARQLSNGVGFLMKKHKITVIAGEAKLTGKGKIAVTKDGKSDRVRSEEHRARDRRAGADDAGAGARRKTDLDLSRGDGAAGISEIAAGRRLGRHRHRVRELLSHAGQRGDGRGSAGPRSAGRGRGDFRVRAEGVRQAGHEDQDRDDGREAGEGCGQRHRDDQGEGRQDRNASPSIA